MSVRMNDLEFAFMAANAGPLSAAWIHRDRSEVRTADDLVDEDAPPPSDDREWVEIPSAETLGLKRELVRQFMQRHCPQLAEPIQRCFLTRGAWGAFKELLERHGLLGEWEGFERRCTHDALVAWAAGQSITVVDDCAAV
jgi:hypothetical protein